MILSYEGKMLTSFVYPWRWTHFVGDKLVFIRQPIGLKIPCRRQVHGGIPKLSVWTSNIFFEKFAFTRAFLSLKIFENKMATKKRFKCKYFTFVILLKCI